MVEINFIKKLISNLRIPSDIIRARFGNCDSLIDESFNINSLDIS